VNATHVAVAMKYPIVTGGVWSESPLAIVTMTLPRNVRIVTGKLTADVI
jgi:hypothetical protein